MIPGLGPKPIYGFLIIIIVVCFMNTFLQVHCNVQISYCLCCLNQEMIIDDSSDDKAEVTPQMQDVQKLSSFQEFHLSMSQIQVFFAPCTKGLKRPIMTLKASKCRLIAVTPTFVKPQTVLSLRWPYTLYYKDKETQKCVIFSGNDHTQTLISRLSQGASLLICVKLYFKGSRYSRSLYTRTRIKHQTSRTILNERRCFTFSRFVAHYAFAFCGALLQFALQQMTIYHQLTTGLTRKCFSVFLRLPSASFIRWDFFLQ